MKTIFVIIFTTTLILLADNSCAIDMPDAAKKNKCTACHAIDKKIVGPSWIEISKFYNGKTEKTTAEKTLKEATGGKAPAEWLITKVSNGGTGNWGRDIMMPIDPTGKKQADINGLVEFILRLAK